MTVPIENASFSLPAFTDYTFEKSCAGEVPEHVVSFTFCGFDQDDIDNGIDIDQRSRLRCNEADSSRNMANVEFGNHDLKLNADETRIIVEQVKGAADYYIVVLVEPISY